MKETDTQRGDIIDRYREVRQNRDLEEIHYGQIQRDETERETQGGDKDRWRSQIQRQREETESEGRQRLRQKTGTEEGDTATDRIRGTDQEPDRIRWTV